MLRDHKVPFRREESLAESALACRRFASNENLARFNVVDFVERVLPSILATRKKGPLKISFFDAAEGDIPAFVTFNPLTLHVDREVWELAKLGDPHARFIIAHELGHILLHYHYAQAFSNDPSNQIKFVQNEERAEWQADTFASYFLITPRVLDAFPSSQDLARSCEVPQFLADERFEAAIEAKRRSARCARAKGYTGDACGECGNFTLLCNGTRLKCDTCGATTECS
jgi:IrrE N-terminal-like domain